MFSYYGSKSKIVHLYPAPKHDLIIEPFAGSARYSLKYFERDVVLIDKYKVIIGIWKWLQQCSPNDILSLPILKHGDHLDNYKLDCIEQKWFLGFCLRQGIASPRYSPSGTGNFGNYKPILHRVSKELYKIKHWKFIHGEYDCVETECTWFIDPPYFKGGEHYRHSTNKLDFNSLAEWCKKRKGQVIVCENDSASWLPFMPLRKMTGSIKTTYEVFWTNEKVEYQTSLF